MGLESEPEVPLGLNRHPVGKGSGDEWGKILREGSRQAFLENPHTAPSLHSMWYFNNVHLCPGVQEKKLRLRLSQLQKATPTSVLAFTHILLLTLSGFQTAEEGSHVIWVWETVG